MDPIFPDTVAVIVVLSLVFGYCLHLTRATVIELRAENAKLRRDADTGKRLMETTWRLEIVDDNDLALYTVPRCQIYCVRQDPVLGNVLTVEKFEETPPGEGDPPTEDQH